MEYEVIWSEFSEFQLDEIFEYYVNETSLNVAIEIIQGILNKPEILRKSPFIG